MKKFAALALLLVFFSGAVYAAKSPYDVYNDALDLYGAHDYKGAVKLYKKVIKEKPDFAKAYNACGLAYIAQKQVDHAIFYYKKAVFIDKNYAEAWYNYAVAMDIKDPKSLSTQEDYYLKAIGLMNDDHIMVRSALNLAKIYRKQGKHDEGIMLLRNAMKKEPAFEELYNEAGLIYIDAEIYDRAVEMFKKAVELRREYVEAQTNLAIAYQKQGNLAASVTQLEETLAKDDNFAGAQYSYGNAMLYNGYYDKAIEHLKKAVALDKNLAEGYYSLGKAYLHKQMFEESEASLKAALKIRKNYTLAKKLLDEVRVKQKAFRSHITFPKIKTEGEEGEDTGDEELTDAQKAEKLKKQKEMENVEDLRLSDDKPKKAEGEEDEEGTEKEEEF
ncbi:MAG: tetratricopeptide repeat protein [Spirochaetia bacterium]|nr:tetratricopeptide repeat protein [Spirochaetia bacterium]